MPTSRAIIRLAPLSSLPQALPWLALALWGLMPGQVAAGERRSAAASPYKLAIPTPEFFRVSNLDQYKLCLLYTSRCV